ncbi:MAG: class I SAM-dependent methyltransferase [Planctomycetota bacterium]
MTEPIDPRDHHLRLLAHPVVHAYVSLRAFGDLTSHGVALLGRAREHTARGHRVLCIGVAAPRVQALAAALPDRQFVVVEPSGAAPRTDALRTTHNIEALAGGLDPLDRGSFHLAVAVHSLHHVADLERLWDQLARALHPGGSLLAQEYVGPAGLRWPAAQRELAESALHTLVPRALRGGSRTGTLTAAPAPPDALEFAPRSHELVATCQTAGFELEAAAGGGCGLLIPALLDRTDAFDPADWQHNAVLGALFREEDRRMRAGELSDDYAMFIARRPT